MTTSSRERAAKAIAQHLPQAILIAIETLDDNRARTPAAAADAAGRAPGALLDVEELSVRLGVPAKTIYDWRSRPVPYGPPAIKIGRYLRWKPEVVEEWLATREEG